MAKMITNCTIYFRFGEDERKRIISNVLHVDLDNRMLLITGQNGLTTGIPVRRIDEFYTWQEEEEDETVVI